MLSEQRRRSVIHIGVAAETDGQAGQEFISYYRMMGFSEKFPRFYVLIIMELLGAEGRYRRYSRFL
jgi:hypothetical protein